MLRRIALAVSLLCTSAALGQIATGTYQFGEFHNHGLDTINVGNLNAHLTIPVVTKVGRGQSFYYNLAYDSSLWYPVSTNGVLAWNASGLFGWTGDTQAATGYITYSTVVTQVHLTNPTTTCTVTYYTNWTYHDQFQGPHAFSTGTSIERGGDERCSYYEFDDFSERAQDGSGYTLNVYSDTNASLTSRDGKTIAAPVNNPAGSAAVTDANGNQISANGTGTYTDTLGQTALSIANNGSKTLTYKDATGTSRNVVMAYRPYTVQTNFGCSGISEYGPLMNSLVDSITLADGSAYHFTYEVTPQNAGSVTGRIASVTLPSGGIITYSYTGANNGVECADGSIAGLTRTASSDSPSTTWTYARTTSSTGSHTNVTDGLGNSQDYDFVQPTATYSKSLVGALLYEVNRNIWSGGNKANGHVYSQQTCFNKSGAQCLSTAISLPITQVDTFQQFSDGDQAGTTTTYNSYGEVTEVDTHDYGGPYMSGKDNRGGLLSKELLVYGGATAPANLVSSDVLDDANGNMASQTTYAYDQTTPTPSSGVPSHVAVSAPRGNLTTQTTYVSSSAYYTFTFTYEDTGTLLTSVDPVNGTTAYSYDGTFTFPTGTSMPTPSSGVAMNIAAAFDQSYTGLPLSSTDVNTKTTSIAGYDALLRPTEVDSPDGGKTTMSYSATSVSMLRSQTASVTQDTETRLDGYGRVIRIGVANASGGWYLQDTCYDGNSNVSFKSYAYTSSSLTSAQVCSGAGDTYSYDGLNRVTKIAHGDGSGTSVAYLYTGRAVQVTDEGGVSRISQVDGLGRTTLVCEETTTALNSVSPVGCGADIGGIGFVTNYAYNLAGHSTIVTQGFGTSAAEQRRFTTDWIGRPLSTSEPERGATTYAYSNNSTGLQVVRTRPSANQKSPSVTTTRTTQYDTLGRILSNFYSDGTPPRTFTYDAALSWSGGTQHNLVGRVSEVNTTLATGSNPVSAITYYSYDTMGHPTLLASCRPSTCGVTPVDQQQISYDLAGDMLTSTDGNNVTTTYTYTKAGELNGATTSLSDAQDPASLISSVAQGVFGPTSFHFGNGVNAVNSYDTMGRWNGRWVCTGSTSANCTGGTQLDGTNVTWQGSLARSVTDTYANQTSTYGYDGFNRLTSTTVGGTKTYSYAYDLFGNRLSQNSQTLTFNGNNQMVGFSYDAAGNLLQDAAGNNYTYDAEGNVIQVTNTSVGTVKYTYDGANRRVRVDKGSSYQEYDYNAAGKRVSIWNGTGGTTNVQGKYYAGSEPIGYYSGGAIHFEHQDWLGTERIRTTYNGAVEGRYSQAAFGDNYSAIGTDTDDNHYVSLDLDAPMQTGHAQFRELDDTHGRWFSPDPYDGSYDWSNPQSFNRYVYVLNNPMSLIDPSGLDYGYDCGDQCVGVVGTPDPPPPPDPWQCMEYGNCPGVPGGNPPSGPGTCQASNGSAFPCPPPPAPPKPPNPGPAPNNAGHIAGCFAKGALVGAAGAVVAGGLAVGAVTLGAPVAAVTITLGLAGAAGAAATAYFTGSDIAQGNYASAAYGAGSLAGGLVAGGLNAANTVFGLTGEYGTPFSGFSNESSMNVYQNPGQSYGSALAAASAKGPTQAGAAGATGGLGSFLHFLRGGC